MDEREDQDPAAAAAGGEQGAQENTVAVQQQQNIADDLMRTPWLTTYGGCTCVCNLVWEPNEGRKLSSRRSSGNDEYILKWDDRVTTVSGVEFSGYPALLSLIVADLQPSEYTGAVIVAYAVPHENLWFSAVIVNGKPVLGEEMLFATKEDLCTHLFDSTDSTTISRVFASQELIESLSLSKPVAALRNSQMDQRDFDLFKKKSNINLPRILRFAIPLIILLAVLIYINPFAKPPEAVEQVVNEIAHVENFDMFREGCEGAFASPWPSVPGWSLSGEGCATQRMNDPEVAGRFNSSATAYQIFNLKSQHNDILSRRAAERIFENFPEHQVTIEQGRLLVLSPFEVDYVPLPDNAPPPPRGAQLKSQVENAFIGIADNIADNGSIFSIKTPASLSEVLRRVEGLGNVHVDRLQRISGNIDLVITAQRPIYRVP